MRGVATDRLTRKRVAALAAQDMGIRPISRALGLPVSTVRGIVRGVRTCANRHIRVECEAGHFLLEVGENDSVALKLRCRRCERDVIVSVDKGRITYPALT